VRLAYRFVLEGDWVEGSGKILHSTNWLGTAYFGLRRS